MRKKIIAILGLALVVFGCQKSLVDIPNNVEIKQADEFKLSQDVISSLNTAKAGGELILVYGPWRYERTHGKPNVYTDTIWGPMGDTLIFVVVNGDGAGNYTLSSVRIWLNDEEIFSPCEFNHHPDTLVKEIVLPQEENVLKVRLTSKPGGYITIGVLYLLRSNLVRFAVETPEEPPADVVWPDDYTISDVEMYRTLGFDYSSQLLLNEQDINAYYEEEQTLMGSNNVDYMKSQPGDVVSGHPANWLPGTFSHDGIVTANPWTIPPEYRLRAWTSIDAHPSHGVNWRNWNFWRGYKLCLIQRVNCYPKDNATYRAKAVTYAKLQRGEPYSYRAWLWKYYTDKWCCSSLVWACYYRIAVWGPWYARKHIDLDCNGGTSVSPNEIVASWRTYYVTSSGSW